MKMKLNKRIWGIVVSVPLFLICFWGVFHYVDRVMEKKDGGWGLDSIRRFYDFKHNSLDVIFIGSSHAYMVYNPSIFWMDAGISSCVLGSDNQPFWNSYYFLKEALKYQKPKIVVLNALPYVFDFTYDINSDNNANQYTATHGLRWSINKIEDIIATSASNSMRANLFFGFPIYHSRRDITHEDFCNRHYWWYSTVGSDTWFNGYVLWTSIEQKNKRFTLPISEDMEPISEKEELYIRKIIELCRNNGVKLVVSYAPVSELDAWAYNIKRLNYFKRIIEENNDVACFIDYNTDAFYDRLNFPTDWTFDGHLNVRGATKVSHDLARYLHEHYHLPDHRADPVYASWNAWAADCQKALDAAANGK